MNQPQTPHAEEHRRQLLQVASRSILHGLEQHRALTVDPADYPPELRAPTPVFVTLMLEKELRGCIGILESDRSLVENTAYYAHAAAFSDSRFPALTRAEFPGLVINISILSALEDISRPSEEELLNQIRPGIDGLLFEDGYYRGTLLPSVWEAIPEPREFLRRLKIKAGLYGDYWESTVKVRRYTTECFAASAGTAETA